MRISQEMNYGSSNGLFKISLSRDNSLSSEPTSEPTFFTPLPLL